MNGKATTTTLVTVTYGDRLNFLSESIQRVLLDERVGKAVVVSNASSSKLDSLEDRWGSRIKIIRLPENTGSANGYRVGIKAAVDDGAEFLWLLDDDNIPARGALQTLFNAWDKLAKPGFSGNLALLSFRASHHSGLHQGFPPHRLFTRRGSFIDFHILDIPYKLWSRTPWGKPGQAVSLPETIPLPHAIYGGLLIHGTLVDQIGLPNSDLILYGDDVEYTSRITEKGGRIYLVPAAVIEDLEPTWNEKAHHGSFMAGWLCGGSDFRAFYSMRNLSYISENKSGDKLWRSFNRIVYLTIMFIVAIRLRRLNRFRLLVDAVRKGRTSRLGIDPRFPLP